MPTETRPVHQGTTAATALSMRWITGRRYDLLCYIVPCVVGYAMVYLHLGLGYEALLLWWLYVVLLDGPHIFATLSRTIFDREERAQRMPLFKKSLLLFAPGPLAVGMAMLTNSRQPYLAFLVLANLWAYWHVVRQHYGFLCLYQRKNGEAAGRDNVVDYWAFYGLMVLPFASFALRHPDARASLGLAETIGVVDASLVSTLHVAIVAVAVIYVGKEVWRVVQGLPWNGPKNLFLLACVPLHLFVFLHPVVSTQSDLLMFAVFVTMYHNVQYHGIVWFYNRNRYGSDRSGERYGLASLFSRNFLIYYAVGLGFTVVLRYSLWLLNGQEVPLGTGPNTVSHAVVTTMPHFTVAEIAVAVWWGFALNHYWLDQYIWRTSKDARLNRDLKVG